MSKYLIILLFTGFILSCSGDDDSVVNIESQKPPMEEPTEETPEIGLQSFELDDKYTFPERIFKTSYGYLSFEIINRFGSTLTVTESDLIIRKLDEKLELLDENILDTDTYQSIAEAKQIDDETYIIAGYRSPQSDSINRTPIIQKVKDTGEVLNTVMIENFPESSSPNGEVSDIYYASEGIYAAINFSGNTTAIIAYDMNFEEKWHRSFTGSRFSKIYNSDEGLYFFNNTKEGESNIYDTKNAYSLDAITGETLWSNSYANNEGSENSNFNTYKVLRLGDNLYLIGDGRRKLSATNSFLVFQGTILVVNANNGQEVDRILSDSFWAINDAEFFGQNLILGGWNEENQLKLMRINLEGNISWEYEYIPGPFSGAPVKDVIISDEKIIFTTAAQKTPNISTFSYKVLYGILNASDGKLQ